MCQRLLHAALGGLLWPTVVAVLLVVSPAIRAEEGESPAIDTPGGKSEHRFTDLSTATHPVTKKVSHVFIGRNVTRQQFKDFELELTGCGPDAKFHRVKVYPRVTFDEEGELAKIDRKSDWDVDDDGSGLSDQKYVPNAEVKEGPNPGNANEADNVDETPGTSTRVDANGGKDPGGVRGRDVPPDADAIRNQTEDPDETRTGDPEPRTPKELREPLDGDGGVQPGDSFMIEFELTAAAQGDECVFALVPSGVGGRQIAFLEQGPKPGLEPGQEYASLPGAAPSLPYAGIELAFTPGGSFGSIGTRQETSFGGKSKGDDIHYEAANLHGDIRYYLGDIGGPAFFQPELFVGLKGSVSLGGSEQGLREDNHPPASDADSFVSYEIGGTLTPHLGLVVADWDCARVNLLAGPRITFATITGTTDESGGGGVEEKFERDVVQVGPAVGVELDLPLPREWYDGLDGGVRVATWGEYLPGVDVSGSSSSFAFDYRFSTRGAFLFTLRAGLYLRFGGP